jgi:Rho GTPase-activating protein 1
MSGIRAHIAGRLRSSSLSAVPPRPESKDYSPELARHATSILYQSPIPSKENRPVYILNAAALPDSREENFDQLLPYVLARLPEEDDLVRGYEYEVVFFAGDSDGSATAKRNRPGWGWFLQAYHVLSRAMRKRLQKLYIVHEKAWVRILAEVFSTIVSPKFRRKIYHTSTLTNLALHIPIENLLIPPSTYLYDRRLSDDIYSPYASGRRAFGARQPFPPSSSGKTRFPRVLRETTSFVLMPANIKAEGLFRVPPHSKLRDVLKEAYDRGQKYIVWKDNGTVLPLPPYPHAEHQDDIIDEIDPKDAYSVFMAAALIKAWYASLRQPIFTTESYRDLKRLYGDPDDVPDVPRLTELFSPSSEWSFLPAVSREILVRHLLPLMSAVSLHEEQNKMTAENLAVCIAPALLCGPDQLEDAKMSSIVRRILTAAIELWAQGLRDACGQTEEVFEKELLLPPDKSDWEDPLAGEKTEEPTSWDENQSTGIILQDNESVSTAAENVMHRAPPLPPRMGATSGRSSGDSVTTKRKPAPPLQVPPRYSTVITDNPLDSTESPLTYAATTDGFAPRREDHSSASQFPDDKKSGTDMTDSSTPLPIILPKRKALTAAQIDNAEHGEVLVQARRASEVLDTEVDNGQRAQQPMQLRGLGLALPGLADIHSQKPSNAPPVRRKAMPSGSPSAEQTGSPIQMSPDSAEGSPTVVAAAAIINDFRRPSVPASANREPTITSLARPVYPTVNPVTGRPASKSTSLPVPGPRHRAPSPALLSKMPSFEQPKKDDSLAPPAIPRRLNLKKKSVDDLRRLYEERAGTASVLVEAGRKNSVKN